MPAISATLICSPRKTYYCECGEMIDGPHVRAYGYACEGDPRRVLRLCLGCASESKDKKIYGAVLSEPSHGQKFPVAKQRAAPTEGA